MLVTDSDNNEVGGRGEGLENMGNSWRGGEVIWKNMFIHDLKPCRCTYYMFADWNDFVITTLTINVCMYVQSQ